MSNAPKVSILMGSASDLPVMAEAGKILNKYEVPFELAVTSAHRSPERTLTIVREAVEKGVQVFIVGAGMAAHLAGVVAAHTTRPVLGVPMEGKLAGGLDAMLSTVQMPRGVPVGTLALGKSGAVNAAILACQIMALSDSSLAKRLEANKVEMADAVAASDEGAQADLPGILGA